MLEVWGAPPSAPSALVEAGLWERESGGYLFCNWHEYQPSKRDVDADREASRARMRELRERRKQKKQLDKAEEGEAFGRTGANGSENVRNPDPTRPDPTRPDPTRPDPTIPKGIDKEEVANATSKKRGERLPAEWKPLQKTVDTIIEEYPALDYQREHKRFVDYWIAQPGQKGVKLDWEATWRNWMRRKGDEAGAKPSPSERAQRTVALATDLLEVEA